MAKTRNRRQQSPKVREYRDRAGYRLVDRRSASSKTGFVGRWLRIVPAHVDGMGMPNAGPGYQVNPGPEHLGLRPTQARVSDLSPEAQQQWADDATEAGIIALLEHEAESRPEFNSFDHNLVALADLVRFHAETLEFALRVEADEGPIPPEYAVQFARDAREFGIHHAAARIPLSWAFSAFESDPKVRQQLIREAQRRTPFDLHLDEDGFCRLYA